MHENVVGLSHYYEVLLIINFNKFFSITSQGHCLGDLNYWGTTV